MLGDITKLSDGALCLLIKTIGERIAGQGMIMTKFDATELAQVQNEMDKRELVQRLELDGFWQGEGTA